MKNPSQCSSLNDIREAIDSLDLRIIEALGERMHYVKEATRFKPSEQAIPDPDRVVSMLSQRRAWAEKVGLDSHFVEPLYAQIIYWFIGEQTRHWRQKRGEQ